MYPRRGRGPRAVDLPGREHRSTSVKRRPSPGHPIAPTEFFKGRSAPELVRQASKAHCPETATYGPQKEDAAGRSHRPVGRRLPAGAYPQKSESNLSQGPIIHRPHPHRKHTGSFGVSGAVSPNPREGVGDRR
jgi:hypothetical protein